MKFCNLYTGMSSKLDEFVDLYPIHPAYIDVFNKIYLIENRHILKNISLTIKDIFNTDVPSDAPGIISFDNYWTAIKSNGLLRSDVTISRVVNASQQLEDIINTSFPKPAYKPLAIKIIYALSVHRLTTNGLDVQFGLTAENLKDDLCLYLMMPEQDADFLLGIVKATLRDIMTTVSGQFIICNEANNQYYIDVDKVVDYDEKIKQKASLMADGELNRYFYQVVYSCLEWDKKQYVSGFNIYEHDLNWDSHNIFREGYLFMGLPGERSTAQPERDFYLHIMQPYGNAGASRQDLEDEVYFYFKSNDEFRETISLYAASCSLADISEGKDKIYRNRENLGYCKERGIRLSGPALGRPKKGEERNKVQDYQDECERVEVERKFGKWKCGMGLVTAKLEETAAHVVALSILLLNLRKIQCAFLQFWDWLLGFLQSREKQMVIQ